MSVIKNGKEERQHLRKEGIMFYNPRGNVYLTGKYTFYLPIGMSKH